MQFQSNNCPGRVIGPESVGDLEEIPYGFYFRTVGFDFQGAVFPQRSGNFVMLIPDSLNAVVDMFWFGWDGVCNDGEDSHRKKDPNHR